MKVTDLMIGDWVITSDGIVKTVTRRDFEDNDFERYSSIPLTPEILEMNGFIRDGYLRLNLGDNLYLEYYVYQNRLRKIFHGIDEWDNHAEVKDITFECQCHYVHELQHALKLCGVEKEIVL